MRLLIEDAEAQGQKMAVYAAAEIVQGRPQTWARAAKRVGMLGAIKARLHSLENPPIQLGEGAARRLMTDAERAEWSSDRKIAEATRRGPLVVTSFKKRDLEKYQKLGRNRLARRNADALMDIIRGEPGRRHILNSSDITFLRARLTTELNLGDTKLSPSAARHLFNAADRGRFDDANRLIELLDVEKSRPAPAEFQPPQDGPQSAAYLYARTVLELFTRLGSASGMDDQMDRPARRQPISGKS
jgi:hypothetical protein